MNKQTFQEIKKMINYYLKRNRHRIKRINLESEEFFGCVLEKLSKVKDFNMKRVGGSWLLYSICNQVVVSFERKHRAVKRSQESMSNYKKFMSSSKGRVIDPIHEFELKDYFLSKAKLCNFNEKEKQILMFYTEGVPVFVISDEMGLTRTQIFYKVRKMKKYLVKVCNEEKSLLYTR